mmetsp:Transcript_8548/g.25192  ORF Transcript_8548/g.25192 Transcript_8548/m.25192 type:complete len:240 (-) Transcript_8548:78-797(-)
MAALTVTISFPYMLELQGADFSEFGSSAAFHEGFLSTCSLLSTVGFLLSTVHAVLSICFMGELTGDVEAAIFTDRLGLLNLASFILWLVGIGMLAITVFYHFVLFSHSDWSVIVAFSATLVLIALYVPITFFQQKVLFDTKYESYRTPPQALTVEQVDEYAVQFCQSIGVTHISPEALTHYIELTMPAAGGAGAVQGRMNVLSSGTIKLVGKIADSISDAMVAAAFDRSKAVARVLAAA